jgi:invasion protein IalB
MFRIALFLLALALPAQSSGEAFSQKRQHWTLSCPDGRDQPASCIAIANVFAEGETEYFLKAVVDNGNDGSLKVVFFVSAEARFLPHVSIYVDPDMKGLLSLQPCTAASCNFVWTLSKEQKDKLLSTETLVVAHATYDADCIRIIRIALPTAGLEETLDELANARAH